MRKSLALALIGLFFAASSMAADKPADKATKPAAAAPAAPAGDCAVQATEKKLAGAAKNSFMKKCEKDAGAAAGGDCAAKAAEKKLAGAAKNSFVKKCEKDAAAGDAKPAKK
jgi:hypothetical protein